LIGTVHRGSDIWQMPLETPGQVGPVAFTESVFGLVPGLDASPYWAARVSGEVRGVARRDGARREAARQLRLVSALLSLVYEPGVRPVTWPRVEGDRPLDFEDKPPEGPPGSHSGAISVVDGWWERAEANEIAAGALLMFHEGMLLRDQHPSMAMVAFVAAIEAIGTIDKPPDPPCPECGQKKGALRAFRHALKAAGFDGKRLKAAEAVYEEFRSPTVHQARAAWT